VSRILGEAHVERASNHSGTGDRSACCAGSRAGFERTEALLPTQSHDHRRLGTQAIRSRHHPDVSYLRLEVGESGEDAKRLRQCVGEDIGGETESIGALIRSHHKSVALYVLD
jgi:hypothetical protein